MSLRDEMVSLVPEDADFEEQKRVFSGKTEEFKARLKAGETLDDILPEAYALVEKRRDVFCIQNIIEYSL